MADGLADVDGPATAPTRVSDWIRDHADSLGARYANELDRHFRQAELTTAALPRFPG